MQQKGRRVKEQMEEEEIIGGTSNVHKSTACFPICLRLFKLLYTYRSDRTTDNELVYIQQNKWALRCPFCEAHCCSTVWY